MLVERLNNQSKIKLNLESASFVCFILIISNVFMNHTFDV